MKIYPFLLAFIFLALGCSKENKNPAIPEKSETVYSNFRYGKAPEKIKDTAFVIQTVINQDSIFHTLSFPSWLNPDFLTIKKNVIKINYFQIVPLDSPDRKAEADFQEGRVNEHITVQKLRDKIKLNDKWYPIFTLNHFYLPAGETIDYISPDLGYLFTVGQDSVMSLPSDQFSPGKEKRALNKLIQAILDDTGMMPPKGFYKTHCDTCQVE